MTARALPLPALAAAAAGVAALLLQLAWLGDRPLWLDESWSRWMAGQSWPGLHDSTVRLDTHPPFYYALLKLWLQLAPATPLGLRLPSVLAALAILPLAWLGARRIPLLREARWAPPLVLALAAVSPVLVAAARQARPYALFALAFALALWAALRLIDDADDRRPAVGAWLAYLAGLEATLWLHSLGAVFGAAIAAGLFAALAATGQFRRRLLPFLAVHLAAGLAWLPGLLIVLEQRREWAQTWLRFAWSDVPSGLASGLAGPGVAGALPIMLALAGAAFLIVRRADRGAGLVLAAAAFLPAAAVLLLSAASAPVFLPRTLVPSALPLLLLAAAGLARLGEPRLRLAAAGAVLALGAASSAALATRPPEERWPELAAWLSQRVEADEEVWLLPNELVLPLRYAADGRFSVRLRGIPADFPAPDHRGPRYSGTAAVPGMSAADAERLVREVRQRGLRGVWIVQRFPRLFDPKDDLAAAFGRPPAARSPAFAPLLIDYFPLGSAVTPPPGRGAIPAAPRARAAAPPPRT